MGHNKSCHLEKPLVKPPILQLITKLLMLLFRKFSFQEKKEWCKYLHFLLKVFLPSPGKNIKQVSQ
jgi:hypothetical protein